MTSGTLRNQHQGLHYLPDTVSANVKTLFTQLNTHAPTAICRIHFSMNMLSRRMKHQNICSGSWPPAPFFHSSKTDAFSFAVNVRLIQKPSATPCFHMTVALTN